MFFSQGAAPGRWLLISTPTTSRIALFSGILVAALATTSLAAEKADKPIDYSKTKVGYEIPLNRHFYRYEPPRELDVIEDEIKGLEGEILELLKEVTA